MSFPLNGPAATVGIDFDRHTLRLYRAGHVWIWAVFEFDDDGEADGLIRGELTDADGWNDAVCQAMNAAQRQWPDAVVHP